MTEPNKDNPIVTALELPPGPDGKAHPDFWINGTLNANPGYPVWICGSRASRRTQIMREWGDGEIYPNAARSIAWLWRETQRNLSVHTNAMIGSAEQANAWDECARGDPAYTRLPVVGFGEGKT